MLYFSLQETMWKYYLIDYELLIWLPSQEFKNKIFVCLIYYQIARI